MMYFSSNWRLGIIILTTRHIYIYMWTCLFALQVFLGLCTLSSKKANVRDVVIRCWCHEIQRAHLARLEHPNRHMSRKYGICLEKPSEKRFVKWQVFGDRLTDNQDSKWMATQIRGLLTRIGKIFQFTEYTQTYIYIYTVVLCMLLDPGYDCLLLYLHAFCTSYRSS